MHIITSLTCATFTRKSLCFLIFAVFLELKKNKQTKQQHAGREHRHRKHRWTETSSLSFIHTKYTIHSDVVGILLARKTMRCTRRANIHLCLCEQVQMCASVYMAACTIHNYTVWLVQLYMLTAHADTRAPPNTQEWRSNEVRWDAAEQSVKPQLADTQLTTSVALFSNRGSLSDCIRRDGNSGVHWSWTQRDGEKKMHIWKSFTAAWDAKTRRWDIVMI